MDATRFQCSASSAGRDRLRRTPEGLLTASWRWRAEHGFTGTTLSSWARTQFAEGAGSRAFQSRPPSKPLRRSQRSLKAERRLPGPTARGRGSAYRGRVMIRACPPLCTARGGLR